MSRAKEGKEVAWAGYKAGMVLPGVLALCVLGGGGGLGVVVCKADGEGARPISSLLVRVWIHALNGVGGWRGKEGGRRARRPTLASTRGRASSLGGWGSGLSRGVGWGSWVWVGSPTTNSRAFFACRVLFFSLSRPPLPLPHHPLHKQRQREHNSPRSSFHLPNPCKNSQQYNNTTLYPLHLAHASRCPIHPHPTHPLSSSSSSSASSERRLLHFPPHHQAPILPLHPHTTLPQPSSSISSSSSSLLRVAKARSGHTPGDGGLINRGLERVWI